MKVFIKQLVGFFYYYFFKAFTSKKGNRILLYHSIGSELEHDTYGISISRELFEEHLSFLKNNYKIVPLDQNYSSYLLEETISLTFDDGYKDNLIVLELCEKLKIPFTLYITTGEIGNKDYLTEEDILKFKNSKYCTLGTHSVTHPFLSDLSREKQLVELRESKISLEKIVGTEVTYMSYPNGSYNNDTLEIVQDLGYKLISSSNIGLNKKSDFDNLALKRVEIVASDSIKELKKKINGFYDFLSLKGYIKNG